MDSALQENQVGFSDVTWVSMEERRIFGRGHHNLCICFPKILTHKVGGRIPLLTMARGRECPYTTHRATCDQTQPLPKQMGVQKK